MKIKNHTNKGIPGRIRGENLMNSEHKATNDKYRDNYDRVFKHKNIGQSFDEFMNEEEKSS